MDGETTAGRATEGILAVLGEGTLNGTPKLGLLLALIDIANSNYDEDGFFIESAVDPKELALAYLSIYWDHSLPWSRDVPLKQLASSNRDHMGIQICNEIRNAVSGTRGHPKYAAQSLDSALAFLRRIESDIPDLKIDQMIAGLWRNPVEKLQMFHEVRSEFLYTFTVSPRTISFLPGVQMELVRFGPILRSIIEHRFAEVVIRLNRRVVQRPVEESVYNYLFAARREMPPSGLRALLLELQNGQCFWSSKPITSTSSADHVVPWAKRKVSTIENFIITPKSVNSSKGAFLISPNLVERWVTYLDENQSELKLAAEKYSFPTDEVLTLSSMRSLYSMVPVDIPIWEISGTKLITVQDKRAVIKFLDERILELGLAE
jgi:hypothetical protein